MVLPLVTYLSPAFPPMPRVSSIMPLYISYTKIWKNLCEIGIEEWLVKISEKSEQDLF